MSAITTAFQSLIDAAAPYGKPARDGVRALIADRRGVSAVEFAFLLPVMMTLYLGVVEGTQGISAKSKVTLTTHTLADLTTQYTDVTNADMSNILNAASAIMTPFPTGNLQAVVSEVTIDSQGNATVTWSDTLNGSALTVGQSVSVPAALDVPNTSLILAQVQYNYTPSLGYVLTGTINLQDQIYLLPRQSATIARTAS
jgi:Flp pilus assembly protein TadG